MIESGSEDPEGCDPSPLIDHITNLPPQIGEPDVKRLSSKDGGSARGGRKRGRRVSPARSLVRSLTSQRGVQAQNGTLLRARRTNLREEQERRMHATMADVRLSPGSSPRNVAELEVGKEDQASIDEEQ